MIRYNYAPLHPQLYLARTEIIHESILKWLKDQKCDAEGVPTCVKKLSEGIYQFKLLSDSITKMWLAELDHIKKFFKENNVPSESPNPQNRHGIILDNFRFKCVFDMLIEQVISPIAKKLWWNIGEDSLFHHNSFTVAYSKTMDMGLSAHRDDSEITVNYCLGSKFKGGDVLFHGVRCKEHVTEDSPHDD